MYNIPMITKPYIMNAPGYEFTAGNFPYPLGDNPVAIRILSTPNNVDFGHYDENLSREVKELFSEIHTFTFDDIEEEDLDLPYANPIKDAQAIALVDILDDALNSGSNVIVHCTAGICRSGAVVEVGVMMGFRDTDIFRSPNLLVKKKMMDVLYWKCN